MSEAEYISAEQIGFWKREGLLAKQCLGALGRYCDGSWYDVYRALVQEAEKMLGATP